MSEFVVLDGRRAIEMFLFVLASLGVLVLEDKVNLS